MAEAQLSEIDILPYVGVQTAGSFPQKLAPKSPIVTNIRTPSPYHTAGTPAPHTAPAALPYFILQAQETAPSCKFVTYMLPPPMRIIEYLSPNGTSPFAAWFNRLDPQAAAKVNVALIRMEMGNLSNVKSVGLGVLEYRIDWGPGYRIYFGRQGDELVILLAGGTKQRQQRDISDAAMRWQEYKNKNKEN
jgi:putative addiction module killer protein